MTLNVEQITKIIRLTGSDKDHEAITALRTAQRLLDKEGLDLATVVEAGLAKSTPKAMNSLFGDAGFWNFHKPAPTPASPRARPKQETFVEVEDIPLGFFNASLKIREERKTSSGFPMLVVDVFYDGYDVIRRYPTMCAFGRQAAKIKEIIGESGEAVSATLRVESPAQRGLLPKIVTVRL